MAFKWHPDKNLENKEVRGVRTRVLEGARERGSKGVMERGERARARVCVCHDTVGA
jgi:hypothetical protein